jgi:S-adenosylmethionine:tRNA ribosyltransferase-isomerase
VSALAFELPAELEAREPPEARGLDRDQVRLMVATRGDGRIVHATFRELPYHLAPGDLVVVNTSATLPAAVAGRREDGTAVEVHFATEASHRPGEECWVIELRSPDGIARAEPPLAGERLTVDGGAALIVVAPYAGGASPRLWLAQVDAGRPLHEYLRLHGHPIRYQYVPEAWPLRDYQTAYALESGSAEMPSAGRPFTPELITRLVARGVQVAPLTLHTGVSSPERDEAPYPEWYSVPETTARLVNAVHGWGGRVVAVGTTVVRALETVAAPDETVRAGRGWSRLIVTPERGLRAIDGLLTGWHEPQASHLQILEASAGEELLARCYDEALAHRYLWHEFGDSHLILP